MSVFWDGEVMKYTITLVIVISTLVGATTAFTSFDVWKPEDWNRSDAKQLVVVDGDVIVAGGR